MPCEATAVSLPGNTCRLAVEADGHLRSPKRDRVVSLPVVQEALRNIAKHANARQVHVTLRRVEEEVRLSVADDGGGANSRKRTRWPQGSACAAWKSGFGWRRTARSTPGRVQAPPSRSGSESGTSRS